MVFIAGGIALPPVRSVIWNVLDLRDKFDKVTIVYGAPIMIKFTLPVLKDLGFKEEDVWTTLENRMKCGLGKCGRCNVGGVYVCKEGPVFTAAQVARMPADF